MRRTQISLTDEERALLDVETARTGRSMSALIRDAVIRVHGEQTEDARLERDRTAAREATGAWQDRDFDGAEYVEHLRAGERWGDLLDR